MSVVDEVERNKLEALELASKIYKVIMDPKFRKAVSDPNIRHRMIVQKYPNFAQAYPVVLRYLSRDLKYNSRAFRLFLDKLERDPGKGMQGFIERQADYARYLYLEINKNNHANRKAADKLWTMEYENMSKWHKKLLEEEKSAKNEFADESQENIEAKRKELLDFINSCESDDSQIDGLDPPEQVDAFHEDVIRMKFELPLKNPKPTFHDIDPDCLNQEELTFLLREMRSYEDQLLTSLENRNAAIEHLETRIEENLRDPYKPTSSNSANLNPQKSNPQKSNLSSANSNLSNSTNLNNEWLQGTMVTINKRKRKNRK